MFVAAVSVAGAVQTTAESPSRFSGLSYFAAHHPEPEARPRTSLHTGLQRVRDTAQTSCFLGRATVGNLRVTGEEAGRSAHQAQSKDTVQPHWKKHSSSALPRKFNNLVFHLLPPLQFFCRASLRKLLWLQTVRKVCLGSGR